MASKLSLKSRLASGDTLLGIFLLSSSPTLAEIVGLSGYDYVVIDMEHGPGGIPEAIACLRALAVTGTPAIIRVPELSAALAKKALDIGPQGIMFPMIESADQAELAVSYCRYPPKGVRGSAHNVVRASAYGFDEGYLKWCREELIVFCQVESETGVAELNAIAAVDGVGGIQIGPRDLSASMGCLEDPDNPTVRETLRTAERRALAAGNKGKGLYLAGMATALDSPGELLRRGYHMVGSGADLSLFRKAALQDVQSFQKAKAAAAAGDEGVNESRPSNGGLRREASTQTVPSTHPTSQTPLSLSDRWPPAAPNPPNHRRWPSVARPLYSLPTLAPRSSSPPTTSSNQTSHALARGGWRRLQTSRRRRIHGSSRHRRGGRRGVRMTLDVVGVCGAVGMALRREGSIRLCGAGSLTAVTSGGGVSAQSGCSAKAEGASRIRVGRSAAATEVNALERQLSSCFEVLSCSDGGTGGCSSVR